MCDCQGTSHRYQGQHALSILAGRVGLTGADPSNSTVKVGGDTDMVDYSNMLS